jgi:hypothetical protein
MSEAELARQLTEVREKGFDEPFALFCAKTFSSFEYSPENLAAARMHAFYLRQALEKLVDANTREELLHGAIAGDKIEGVLMKVTRESYQATLESGRLFCELFVEKWCASFAKV